MADEDVILASVLTIAVAAARKRRRHYRSCWMRDWNAAYIDRHYTLHDSMVMITDDFVT